MNTPDPALGESWTWTRGARTVHVLWEDGALLVRVAAVGRDQELPADPLEAAWLDAAAAALPGATKRWDQPAWEVPPEQVDALRDTLGIERAVCDMHLSRWDPALLDALGAEWRISAYWAIPGGRVQAVVGAGGLVDVEHGGRFRDELQAIVGQLFGTAPFRSLNDVGRDRARAVAARLFAWKPEHLFSVQATGTPAR